MDLLEEFSDQLDELNDRVSDMFIDTYETPEDIKTLVDQLIPILEEYDLALDMKDVEEVFDDWEEPTEYDGVNIAFPLYDDKNEDTEYFLSMTYAKGDEGYIIDFEVQYDWELDEEVGFEYFDLDELDE